MTQYEDTYQAEPHIVEKQQSIISDRMDDPETPPQDHNNIGRSPLTTLQELISRFRNGIEINFDNEAGHFKIDLTPRQHPLVDYRALRSFIGEVTELNAIAGWGMHQQPVYASFTSHSQHHLIITGGQKSGKSGLLKTILTDLTLNTKPSHLQYAIIDGFRQRPNHADHRLQAFEYLPHTLGLTSHSSQDAAEMISFVRDELDYRADNQIESPIILLVIDDYQDILSFVPYETIQDLTYIARLGPTYGIKLVLSGLPPADQDIQDILEAGPFCRMVGQVNGSRAAELASAMLDSKADHLQNKGEFLLIDTDTITHFVAAAVQDSDFKKLLNTVYQQKLPVLLAQNFVEEPIFEPQPQPEEKRETKSVIESNPIWRPKPKITQSTYSLPPTSTPADQSDTTSESHSEIKPEEAFPVTSTWYDHPNTASAESYNKRKEADDREINDSHFEMVEDQDSDEVDLRNQHLVHTTQQTDIDPAEEDDLAEESNTTPANPAAEQMPGPISDIKTTKMSHLSNKLIKPSKQKLNGSKIGVQPKWTRSDSKPRPSSLSRSIIPVESTAEAEDHAPKVTITQSTKKTPSAPSLVKSSRQKSTDPWEDGLMEPDSTIDSNDEATDQAEWAQKLINMDEAKTLNPADSQEELTPFEDDELDFDQDVMESTQPQQDVEDKSETRTRAKSGSAKPKPPVLSGKKGIKQSNTPPPSIEKNEKNEKNEKKPTVRRRPPILGVGPEPSE